MKHVKAQSNVTLVLILLLSLVLAACGGSTGSGTYGGGGTGAGASAAPSTSADGTGSSPAASMSGGSASPATSSSAPAASGGQAGQTGSSYPGGKAVHLIAPAAPGSGWDLTARSLAETLNKEKLIKFPLPVENEAGATGAVSLARMVNERKGDPYYISITSLPIMSNYLRGDSKYSYKDVTMIARLMTEYYMVAVPADSPYKTLKDLLDAVKKDPKSVPIGASGDDRLPFALLVSKVGGDPKSINFVAYEGGGEQTTALLSGDIKAALAGVSEFRGQIEARKFRGLAVLSEKRLGGVVKDVPTAKEAGFDVTLGNWRGVMGPANMPKDAVTYWQDIIDKALKTPTWKSIAEKNQWEITYMKGDEFQQYLDKVNGEMKTALTETGQISGK